MNRITFYVGRPECCLLPKLDREMETLLADVFGGSTCIIAHGSWKPCDSCAIEYEPSMRIEVLTENAYPASSVAERLREIYNQTEVIFSAEAITLERVQGEKIA